MSYGEQVWMLLMRVKMKEKHKKIDVWKKEKLRSKVENRINLALLSCRPPYKFSYEKSIHIQQKSFAPKIWRNSRLFMRNSFGIHRPTDRPTDPFEIFKFLLIQSCKYELENLPSFSSYHFWPPRHTHRYQSNSEEATHKLEIISETCRRLPQCLTRKCRKIFARAHANCEKYACRLCGGRLGWSAEFSCKPQQLQTFAR